MLGVLGWCVGALGCCARCARLVCPCTRLLCQVLHFHLTSFQFAVGLPGYNPFCKLRLIKALCGDQAGKGIRFITGENGDE